MAEFRRVAPIFGLLSGDIASNPDEDKVTIVLTIQGQNVWQFSASITRKATRSAEVVTDEPTELAEPTTADAGDGCGAATRRPHLPLRRLVLWLLALGLLAGTARRRHRAGTSRVRRLMVYRGMTVV